MKIRLLDPTVANKIAAGEVIERPASIVKELVENSIDAGATSITVEIKGGGIELIRVSDNGCGMEREDAQEAFLRHATSKISCADDLNDLSTLGFRGEALASIAAVARVRLLTRTRGSEEGTQVTIEGGVMQGVLPAGCPEGTGLWVEDLFYNTPVRRKFLKKPAQEASAIADVMTRLALSNPAVSLRYIQDGRSQLHTPGDGQPTSCIRAVYGAAVAKEMIPVHWENRGVTVSGFTGSRALQKNNRSWQLLFINGRCVRNALVSAAVQDAYQGRLNIGKFPFFVLSLTMPGTLVDVNVHPSKQEVRFADGLPVYDLVRAAVLNALNRNQEVPSLFSSPAQAHAARETVFEVSGVSTPERRPEKETAPARPAAVFAAAAKSFAAQAKADDPCRSIKESPAAAPAAQGKAIQKPQETPAAPVVHVPPAQGPLTVQEGAPVAPIVPSRAQPVEESIRRFAGFVAQTVPEVATEQAAMPLEGEAGYAVIGQLFSTYILVEAGDEAFLIDQHAAHERLLYEELARQAAEGAPVAQPLLFPAVLNVNHTEQAILEGLLPMLEELGYEVEPMGAGGFAVKAVPLALGDCDPQAFLEGLLDETASLRQLRSGELRRAKLMQLACKSAVKAGDKLSENEIRALMQLIARENAPLSCPHGRPILVRLSRRELEVRFKRIQ